MKKTMFFVMMLVATMFFVPNVFAAECVDYKSGAGTVEDPYRITTNEELYSITCNLDSHFILENDLNKWEELVGIDKLDDDAKDQLREIARKTEEILK